MHQRDLNDIIEKNITIEEASERKEERLGGFLPVSRISKLHVGLQHHLKSPDF